ncbi:MAG: hypothetical protein WCC14_07035 [Acidobacteriaceae bacterium]
MRRPVGVIIAAILLGAIALFGIVGETAALGLTFFYHSPLIPNLPFIRPFMVVTNGVLLLFFLLCAWTVAGLFRMRGWARISTATIGGVVAFFSLLTGVAVLWAGRFTQYLPPGPSSGTVQTVLSMVAGFYFVVALVGIWWLVYFNLASVRMAFAASRPLSADSVAVLPPGAWGSVPEPGIPGWRVVIMVWAWLMLVSAVFLPALLWLHPPMFLFGAVLQGGAGMAAFVVLWLVEIYLGVGLLRKWKPAWYLALFLQVYLAGYCASFLVPGMMTRYLAYQRSLISQWGLPTAAPGGPATIEQGPILAVGFVFTLVLVVLITWALIRRREDYLGPRSVAD